MKLNIPRSPMLHIHNLHGLSINTTAYWKFSGSTNVMGILKNVYTNYGRI